MKVSNIDIDRWVQPWDEERPDDIYDRDERFFSILTKGFLAYMSNAIKMYGKPVRHFIFTTGSSYMYVETNGYEYSVKEVTGEDWIYHERPRCVVQLGNVSIDTNELSQPRVRGTYERRSSRTGEILGYNAEIQGVPVNMTIVCRYVLSTFNEKLVLAQELIDKMLFQKYFSINYLGQVIKVAVTPPQDFSLDFSTVDMSSTEANRFELQVQLQVEAVYPSIDVSTESPNSLLIEKLHYNTDMYYNKDTGNTNSKETVTID